MHTTTAWALLGVPHLADATTIKQAFRKNALVHHPDHGGSAVAFQRLMEAHRVALEFIGTTPVTGKTPFTDTKSGRNHSRRRWLRADEDRVSPSVHRVDCARRQRTPSPTFVRRSFADVLAAAMADA